MSDPATTYRDATYSAETQEQLKRLSAWLGQHADRWRDGSAAFAGTNALRDVIERWDANDATETTFAEGGEPDEDDLAENAETLA